MIIFFSERASPGCAVFVKGGGGKCAKEKKNTADFFYLFFFYTPAIESTRAARVDSVVSINVTLSVSEVLSPA